MRRALVELVVAFEEGMIAGMGANGSWISINSIEIMLREIQSPPATLFCFGLRPVGALA